MTPEVLQNVGLNKTQAKAYFSFIEKGQMSPTKLAESIGESRTNGYMLCEALEKFGLIKKLPSAKTTVYEAEHPLAIEKLVNKKREELTQADTAVRRSMPSLISYYYSFTEKPGVRILQGVEGLKELMSDILRSKKPVTLVRTPKEIEFLGKEYMDGYIKKRRELNIPVDALTPNVASANRSKEVDKIDLFTRTWIPKEMYTAPVEIEIYGDRTAFLIFGEEVMGLIIDNAPLAQSMRQLTELAKASQVDNNN